MDSLEERIIELETRFCFQNEVIESLNQVVTEQDSQIQLLTKKIELMAKVISQNISVDVAANPLDEAPPPHY